MYVQVLDSCFENITKICFGSFTKAPMAYQLFLNKIKKITENSRVRTKKTVNEGQIRKFRE